MRRRTLVGCVVAIAVVASHFALRIPRTDTHQQRDCTERCEELVWFAPARGPGYEDSTSYLRRDLMIAIKYAAANVSWRE